MYPAKWVTTEDWGLKDPKGKPVDEIRQVRDEIKMRVVKLLKQLKINSGKPSGD